MLLCGTQNCFLCLRVSNTEQATSLVVCWTRQEGPERCGRTEVPAPCPGQRDHGPLHTLCVPERRCTPTASALRLSEGGQAGPHVSGTAPGTTSKDSSLCWGQHAQAPMEGRGCAHAAVWLSLHWLASSWPQWRPLNLPLTPCAWPEAGRVAGLGRGPGLRASVSSSLSAWVPPP